MVRRIDIPETRTEAWPELPFDSWAETCETLHLWTQIVGKVALELRHFLNEWWQIAFRLTPRGLTTGTIPYVQGFFAIDFDFVRHALIITTSDGESSELPLAPRSVASFYREIMALLQALNISVSINPQPVEIPGAVSCDIDELHASYDPEYVQRWWRIMLNTEHVLERYRSSFVGKSSPSHFFWGSFDLNETRFPAVLRRYPRERPVFYSLPRIRRISPADSGRATSRWAV